MTEERKNQLEQLDDISLIEELLKYQQDADRYHEKRALSDYASSDWYKYHELLYQANSDVIVVKYIIARRMAGIE